MATSKEEIMAKAAAKLAAMKATTLDDPKVINNPPARPFLQTPVLPVPPKDYAPKARFWCSSANQVLYAPGVLDPITFKNNELTTSSPAEIVFLRTLVKNHPHKFKFLG
jgi:hypothetical protein